jgi:N-methylhydantoinase B
LRANRPASDLVIDAGSLAAPRGSTRSRFEILSTRLAAVNDEAAATMRLVSGSPVANEAYDMNVGLMNAEGDCIAIGVYISIHALSLSATVKDIQREFAENPGIAPGDVFMCNGPLRRGVPPDGRHRSSRRSSSATRLLGWTGSTVHQIDPRRAVRGPGQIGADVDLG